MYFVLHFLVILFAIVAEINFEDRAVPAVEHSRPDTVRPPTHKNWKSQSSEVE